MNVWFEWGFGLGDVLAHFFSPINYRQRNGRAFMLGRIRNGLLTGAVEDVVAVKADPWGDWNASQLWHSLGMRCEGSRDWQSETFFDCVENPSEQFLAIPDGICPLPERRVELPEKYILFHDGASQFDRMLSDGRIVDDLRKFGLPIVRTGSGLPKTMDVDIDLVDRTELPELFFVAKHAEFIVSACTFQRCFASIYGKRVIELMQGDKVEESTIERTFREYAGGEYGINRLNRVMMYPSKEWSEFLCE